MRRPIALAACLLAALAGATACGDDEPSGLPELGAGGGASSTPAPSSSAASSAPAGPLPSASGLPDEAGAVAGKIKATGTGKIVAQAWVSYWHERTLAYNAVDAGRPELAAVATPDQLREIRTRVAELKDRKIHTVGTSTINVSKVAVQGDEATITSCMENRTIDVDERSVAVEPPTPFYGMTGTAVRSGGAWKVSGVEITTRGAC